MKRLALWVGCLLAMLVATANAQQKYPEQWNYVGASLGDDAGLTKFTDLLKQSKATGCTHILMNDSGWLKLANDAAYVERVGKAKATAKDLGITIVPAVYAFGYSGRYLQFDPNMGVGLPVKDMPFLVKGKTAAPDPAAGIDVSKFTGDAVEYPVKPFSYYRVSIYTKEKPSGEVFRASGVKPGRWETRTNTYIKQEGDRWLSTNTFNTLDAEQIRVQVFVKGYDQFKIEPAGALLILRRDTVPLKVTSDDGKMVYEEGKDFKKLVDPLIGSGSGDFESDHKANDIELTDASRIKDGQKLLVSFYHAYKIYADQNGITMEDPKIFELMERDVASCAKIWGATGYFMNYDEIRIGGWEPLTLERKIKPGQLLAEHTKKGYNLIRKYSPDAKIYTWNDMYDATSNARPVPGGAYYLVNGDWTGSWEGLPKDVIIMSWSGSAEGMKFFADRGQSQVLCGYYDARNTNSMKQNIASWTRKSQGIPNILGFMYTTWKPDFTNLKEYFTLLNTYDQWIGSLPAPTTRRARQQ